MEISSVNTLAYVLARGSQDRRAEAIVHQALNEGPNSPLVAWSAWQVNLGDAKTGQGDRAAARGHFQAAVDAWTVAPPDSRGEDLYAYALSIVGRITEAREMTARAVEAYPDSPTTRWCAWNVAVTAGDTGDAAAQKAAAQGRGLSQWWFELPNHD